MLLTARPTMIYFISDLHLHPSHPATVQAFLDFLAGPARQAQSLWILGDLFEYWAGDDDLADPFNAQIAQALKTLSDAGVSLHLIVGNRDFLLGAGPAAQFTAQTGVRVETEPYLLQLGNTPTVLLHGDALCTDDVAYQQFRQMVRNPAWQAQFLSQPLPVRHKIAADLRAKSESAKQEKSMAIMDVNPDAVAQAFRSSGVPCMLHGHTHRPATHTLEVDEKAVTRHVLPDWDTQACGFVWDGEVLQKFSF